ncbi:uncharacterized protein FIBRA_02596 [Fibroporia radiculosa]|uniref:Uncharacterized protein n=1 Tax=Fibroporia radiculosa TaxID=599839 RepID=J4HV68_9APHY|nr:uncharacterized protein FIBRA_02596 [Fibroporia radiculosa]CCM00562.1 predicted protein [Fibroporia radiculosa]
MRTTTVLTVAAAAAAPILVSAIPASYDDIYAREPTLDMHLARRVFRTAFMRGAKVGGEEGWSKGMTDAVKSATKAYTGARQGKAHDAHSKARQANNAHLTAIIPKFEKQVKEESSPVKDPTQMLMPLAQRDEPGRHGDHSHHLADGDQDDEDFHHQQERFGHRDNQYLEHHLRALVARALFDGLD